MTAATATLVDDLVEMFRAAEAAAVAADSEDDGGTCNLDSPAFRMKGNKVAAIRKAAELAGIRVHDFTWYGKKWFWLNVTANGQANRRYRSIRAATNAMRPFEDKIAGLSVSHYMAMD